MPSLRQRSRRHCARERNLGDTRSPIAIPIVDDLPLAIPVSHAEMEAIEIYLADQIDALLSDMNASVDLPCSHDLR